MIELLGYTAFVWVLTSFMTLIIEKINKPNLIKFICLKCWTFWLVLLYTFNPFIAAICSLMGYLLEKHLLKEETQL